MTVLLLLAVGVVIMGITFASTNCPENYGSRLESCGQTYVTAVQRVTRGRASEEKRVICSNLAESVACLLELERKCNDKPEVRQMVARLSVKIMHTYVDVLCSEK